MQKLSITPEPSTIFSRIHQEPSNPQDKNQNPTMNMNNILEKEKFYLS